jgi:hypothetical protein
VTGCLFLSLCRADVLISNIRGVPYLARTGANDVTISPMMSRRMTRLVP